MQTEKWKFPFKNEHFLQEDPYVMWTEQGEQIGATCGRENFQGYIIDLIDKVSDYLKFNYTLCIAGDGTYGKKLENGTWNGVIGELTRGVSTSHT